jgi:hypothetical protein
MILEQTQKHVNSARIEFATEVPPEGFDGIDYFPDGECTVWIIMNNKNTKVRRSWKE